MSKRFLVAVSAIFLAAGSVFWATPAHAETPGLAIEVYTYDPSSTPERQPYTLCSDTVTTAWTSVDRMFHDWGGDIVAGCQGDFVLIHYHGYITWPRSETVVFQSYADDGFWLSIGGQTVIDDWYLKGCYGNQGSFEFVAGQSYALDSWFYEYGGGACNLLYSIDSTGFNEVPASVFTQDALPAVEPDPVPTIEPTPTPEPTIEPTPEPVVETPTSEPVPVTEDVRPTEDVRIDTPVTEAVRPADPSVDVRQEEPVIVPAPEPSPEPLPEPTPPTPAPVVEQPPVVVPEPVVVVPEPAVEPAPVVEPEPVVEPDPTPTPDPEPVVEPTPEAAPDPVVEPTPDPTPEPATDPEPVVDTPIVTPTPVEPPPAAPSPVEVTPAPVAQTPAPVVETPPEQAPPTEQQQMAQLMEQAQADDPQVPEALAAIPLLGDAAVAVLDTFNALGNVGADMTPEVRAAAKKEVVAAVIVTQVAQTAAMISSVAGGSGAAVRRRND